MIKIIIFKQKDISLGFKIEGHALSREEIESTTGDAYDMICNSVSVLSQSVCNRHAGSFKATSKV